MLAPNNVIEIVHAGFFNTRQQSVAICQPLAIEDYGLQAANFASPPKWHLAHTSWFFETFLLKPFVQGYQPFDPSYEVLFNSYYNAIGEQFPRAQRGLLSRPTVPEVLEYRAHIDTEMTALLADTNHAERETILERCVLGIQHEKQHQELILTDIKFSLSKNPQYPAYQIREQGREELANISPPQWIAFDGGQIQTGLNPTPDTFAFDNESPAHTVYLSPFQLADRLVSNQEYQAFVDDGGYQNPEYWLADGWAIVQENDWQQPIYWSEPGGEAMEFTLFGLRSRQPQQPVCHLSAYEADAYANWAGARLPTEFEWEHAATQQIFTHFGKPSAMEIALHPAPLTNTLTTNSDTDTLKAGISLFQLYDSCWQWTSSAYRPYPGFKPGEGAIGEYNGKFMCNQWVLRGGSCVSPDQHLRPSYRNFFYPGDRWQFSGIRLALDIQ